METPETHEVTRLLRRLGEGDAAAEGELIELLYDELKRLARRAVAQRRGSSIAPTALVHDAYLRLARRGGDWSDREHFVAAATLAMRRLLTDQVRRRGAEKRGAGVGSVTLSTGIPDREDGVDAVDVCALDEALTLLGEIDPQQCRIVELRFLGGLSVEETARALGVSDRTVKRKWHIARGWLRAELGETGA